MGHSGQATLELTVALIVIMMLLVAAVRTFVWLNEGMVARQVSYENTRVAAGSTAPAYVDLNPVTHLDNVGADSLVIRDTSGNPEVGFNEPLNADLNLVVQLN